MVAMRLMWRKRRSDPVTPATRIMAASVALACTISLGNAFVAHADDVADQKKKADARIAALGQQLEGTNANLAKAYINLERTNAALPVAQAKLATAQQVQSQAQSAQAQAEATEARAVAAEFSAESALHPPRVDTMPSRAVRRVSVKVCMGSSPVFWDSVVQ